MMDRRLFLKLTGLAAAAASLDVLPALASQPATTPAVRPPGTYQFTGRVRLHEPRVQIVGITNAQQISWSSNVEAAPPPVAGFTSFEVFDTPWTMPDVRVRGGELEALAVVPVDLG